jgi:hypothetical protein
MSISHKAAKAVVYWEGQILRHCTPPQFSKISGGEVVAVMGMSPDDEAICFQTGQKANYSIALTHTVMNGDQEVDWDSLAKTHEEGEFQLEYSTKTKVYWCAVESAEPKVLDGRGITWDVILKTLWKRDA